MVPEAIAFAFVAGVAPLSGLYAAFLVGLITAVIGGRPGMISGATGALAVVMVSLVADHGAQYFTARTRPFQNFIKPLIDEEVIQRWNANWVKIDGKKIWKYGGDI